MHIRGRSFKQCHISQRFRWYLLIFWFRYYINECVQSYCDRTEVKSRNENLKNFITNLVRKELNFMKKIYYSILHLLPSTSKCGKRFPVSLPGVKFVYIYIDRISKCKHCSESFSKIGCNVFSSFNCCVGLWSHRCTEVTVGRWSAYRRYTEVMMWRWSTENGSIFSEWRAWRGLCLPALGRWSDKWWLLGINIGSVTTRVL